MAKQAFIALLLIIAIWIAPTHATAPNVKAEAATGRKLVENFQDQKVEELIKLPHNVMVPSGKPCYPPYLIKRDCICYANFWPPKPQTFETVRTMVGKFQHQTVEKLIKPPQRVGVPLGGACYLPGGLECDDGCICVSWFSPYPTPPPLCGRCIGTCPAINMKNKEMEGYLQKS